MSNYVPPKATEVVYGTVRKATRQEIENNTGDGVVTTENLNVALEGLSITGAIMPFAMDTPPTGWLAANGAEVSTLTYAALFAKIGHTYGGSGTTFKLPDLRGLWVRGLGGGSAALGTVQNDAVLTISGNAAGTLYSAGDTRGIFGAATGVFSTFGSSWGPPGESYQGARGITFMMNAMFPRMADENRVKNLAMLYCIKY